MSQRRRRRNQGRVIAGEVITARTEKDEEVPPGGGLPKEWGKKKETPQSASDTPIFDQMMAEKYTGHYMVA